MSKSAILFAAAFILCCGGALLMPTIGVVGYVSHYCIGPERQWWTAGLRDYGVRMSLCLAAFTAIGLILNFGRLSFGKRAMQTQEWLILAFLAWVWIAMWIGPETLHKSAVDHPTLKLLKVVIFTMMLTHIITRRRELSILLWTLTIGALVLGLQAFFADKSDFQYGRLETVGGPDFAESNVLAAYLGAMLPLIGIQFFRGGWLAKGLALAAGVFATNAIILTRSRGVIVGLAVGAVSAVVLAPREFRLKIIAGVIVAGIGGAFLMDTGFKNRAATISSDEARRDVSAMSRTETWKAGWRLFMAHPMGVGPGNFSQSIGKFAEQFDKRDAHNTYIRCACELGVPGLAAFAAVIVGGLWSVRNCVKRAQAFPESEQHFVAYTGFGLSVSLIIFLACGMFITLLYVETLWWLVALPVCLVRATDNIEAELGVVPAQGTRTRVGRVMSRRVEPIGGPVKSKAEAAGNGRQVPERGPGGKFVAKARSGAERKR